MTKQELCPQVAHPANTTFCLQPSNKEEWVLAIKKHDMFYLILIFWNAEPVRRKDSPRTGSILRVGGLMSKMDLTQMLESANTAWDLSHSACQSAQHVNFAPVPCKIRLVRRCKKNACPHYSEVKVVEAMFRQSCSYSEGCT